MSQGSTSQWLLAYVLDQHGLSLDDVKQTDLTSGDAGAAFVAGSVPVAVTWEPWLSKAEENPDGHVLASTKEYPDIITDEVAFSPDFIKENPDSVRAFIKGYAMAVDFLESSPDEAIADVTEYLGQSPEDVKATMETVPIWSIEESKKFFGTLTAPAPSTTSSRNRASSGRSSARHRASPTRPRRSIRASFRTSRVEHCRAP